MHLTYRLADAGDLDACLHVLPEDLARDADARAHLPCVWRSLLAGDAMTLILVEDEERPPEARLVWHGAGVFVSDSLMVQARQDRQPHVGLRVLEEIRRGQARALEPAAVRDANSGDGLNLLMLHYALAEDRLDFVQAWHVRAKVVEAFHAAFQGYRLKEILLEAHGQERLHLMLAGGFRLRSDYRDFYEGGRRTPPARRPYLVGITREEAPAGEGSTVALLFVYAPPRFFFKPGEQQLLQHALLGETDEALVGLLHLSPSTVKTRWRAIYERVAQAMPDLLPAVAEGAHPEKKRGAEKRRRLLSYLRSHPEELRPVNPHRFQSPKTPRPPAADAARA